MFHCRAMIGDGAEATIFCFDLYSDHIVFFLEVKSRSTAMSYKEHCHVLAFKPSTIFWPYCKMISTSTFQETWLAFWPSSSRSELSTPLTWWPFLSVPYHDRERLKKSPTLTYNRPIACHIWMNTEPRNSHWYNGTYYFHLSLSAPTNLFGLLVGNLHAWYLSNWAWASCLSLPSSFYLILF